ncbi:hypothetical protein Hanom_Chr02g00133791 [Helianthus anomalus]
MKFDIPYDPFSEVITNLFLDFDLGLIFPFNRLILCLLGLELESSFGSCACLDQNTHLMCVFWC